MSSNIDKFEWIRKIIETSTNQFHLEGAKRLIELLYELDKDEKQKDELELPTASVEPNSAFHNEASIFKNVITSAAKAEIAELFKNGKMAMVL